MRFVQIAAVTLLVVHFGLGYALPIVPAMAVVAASVLLNVIGVIARGTTARLGEKEAASYLAYDIVQLGVLLFLTGGLENPFVILAIAPVTVAATVLSRSSIIGLSALTVIAISRPPWAGGG